ncbi:MAG: SAM-dependent methyltransferase [Candidatus Velthaea sp.]
MKPPSLGAEYFERIYAQAADPWDFATSEYEREKYDSTIALLPRHRFQSVFEIGCSIGVLTERLAQHCDRLLAVDINERALAAARERNARSTNVQFVRMNVPIEFPANRFDVIVVSEVAYYWSDADLALARDRIAESAAGGIVELVHFLPTVVDYVRDGDAVHEFFLADPRFERIAGKRAQRYRIDVCAVAAV